MIMLPGQCDVALKEWAGICHALARGRQTLLLRKGGVRERAGQFAPEHEVFWLYPTRVHEAEQGLREPAFDHAVGRQDPAAEVPLDCLARVELLEYVTSEDSLAALEPFHIWTRETIARRFAYRRPGLWVMGIRVFRHDPPWSLLPSQEQLGCQSWVELEKPLPAEELRPVLEDDTAGERLAQLRTALGGRRGTET
jgi:hypothetical protein